MMCKKLLLLATAVWGLMLANSASADDWPQWMGPQRDDVYREEGIVDRIPAAGLPVKWRVPVAGGYSGPAVANGRVFLTDYVIESGKSTNNSGGRDKMTGIERALCFAADTGKALWSFERPREYNLSYANGPRATPTVDDDRVYVLGAEGDLTCLRVATGELVWEKQLAREFKAETPIWGHAAHPLVHGELLYCLAGGPNSVAVALDKMTGEVRWQALSASEIGYCPPIIYTLGGREQLLIWHADSLNSLDPLTGKLIWTYPLQPRYAMAIAAPQISGNRLYASGIGETAVMLEMNADGSPGEALWTGKPKLGVYSGNATALFDGDKLFGADCGSGAFIAVNADDGERLWETFELTTGGERRAAHGTAFAVKHKDKFILFTETGD
ncbi:MAG: PQQ-binding-like beta-propeller repeat protein, partial [Aureliella sp.]